MEGCTKGLLRELTSSSWIFIISLIKWLNENFLRHRILFSRILLNKRQTLWEIILWSCIYFSFLFVLHSNEISIRNSSIPTLIKTNFQLWIFFIEFDYGLLQSLDYKLPFSQLWVWNKKSLYFATI